MGDGDGTVGEDHGSDRETSRRPSGKPRTRTVVARGRLSGNALIPLTDAQRKLVDDNLGLIGVHLRRFVSSLGTPRRDREWEDLFQEGCVGLMRAAKDFDPQRGIAFAAFALPRIHNAVSRALHEKFSVIRTPAPRSRRGCDEETSNRGRGDASLRDHAIGERAPKAYPMSIEIADHAALKRNHDPSCAAPSETVGERIRAKYEQAVQRAGEKIAARASRRGDRDKLVAILREERFLVPSEESKAALRQIARQTKSSYARVAQCDKRYANAIKHALESDPEFRELQRRVRAQPLGGEVAIDHSLEESLAVASADEFVRRYGNVDSSARAAMFERLWDASPHDVDAFLHERVRTLPPGAREKLLRDSPVPGS